MMSSMSDTLPFSEVKAHLSELADRVEGQHDRILVTRNGRPSFVLMSPDDLESLEESLDILRDDELLESLRRSRREASEGKRLRLRDHVEAASCTRLRSRPRDCATSTDFRTRCGTPRWRPSSVRSPRTPNDWANRWWANSRASGQHVAVTTESSTRSSNKTRPS